MVKYFTTGANANVSKQGGFEARSGALEQLEKFKNRCWIDMVNPDDGECDEVSALTGVPEDMIKAALDDNERARTEFDDGCSMFVVDCPLIEESDNGDSYTTLPLALIYNDKCIITVCLKGNTVLKEFITGRERVICENPLLFVLKFMLGNAKRFLYCLKQIDRKTHRIQSEMGRTMRNSEIIQLLDLQNSLVYFSTSLNSNARVHEKLFKVEGVATREEMLDLYDDVIIEGKQAIETCNIYKNILSVTMDAYGSVISNNANDTMRKLTIITIILAIPTMIAGFWGMNMTVPFQTGEDNTSTVWFWVVIAATAVLTVAIALLILKSSSFNTITRRKKKKRKDKKEK
ncbi:MAG: magnesium transporter CorA family protein [Clostridia bacterium]|nr:magnesium transporter CorA family protein [Clostridia bacterium]